ncbi:MJ1477/TM1410 family putative glycoside hydrolase [Bacillus thermotolerans]|uniref:MJ1477/TM1410 family putative glycoside hydrolase n=1 Tax=Bacillus thermotolerans TaxID=1221996 RepID=UPI000582E497|nr:MJ1477/TM1410 family putative glycoside hydrolase [Bacillus thermotolerans]KKB35495.1 hypothetical protein QY97_01673 [Bacillus thermotolerans]
MKQYTHAYLERDLTTEEMKHFQEKRWLYQLQELDLDEAQKSGTSIMVMEPVLGGVKDKKFSKQEIQQLKDQGITPIAYLSIGEISHFQTRWQEEWGEFNGQKLKVSKRAPQWIGKVPNKDWPEGVKVRYWKEDWWELVKEDLDEIMDLGYEGVYLDIIDAFEYWGNEDTYGFFKEKKYGSDPASEREAAERMIQFVQRLSMYAKHKESEFKIVPQNGENILEYDDHEEYLEHVDGIGVEDVWFDEEKPQSESFTEERLSHLEKFVEEGKFVLSVDYVDNGKGYSGANKDRINAYIASCLSQGFYCYPALTNRELDEFRVIEEIKGQ